MASTRDQLFFPNFNPRKSWNRSKCLTHFLSYPNVLRPVVVVGLCHLRHEIGRRLNEYKCDELNDWLMKCVIFCRDFSFARSFVALAFFNAMVFNYVKNKIPKNEHIRAYITIACLHFKWSARFHSKLSTVEIWLINCIHTHLQTCKLKVTLTLTLLQRHKIIY